ncbi:MAG: response regulator [Victivallales bacterium]|nr:response regulator [Victivallales bacterium]
MQDYMYSVFSIVAIVLHLLINFGQLMGRKAENVRGKRYRGFLLGVLAYYLADGAWGIFAGLGWMRLWYFDTILFFLSLVAFVFLWCRFVITYLGLGNCTGRILAWSGYGLLAVNIVLLTANFFNNCVFYFNEQGKYELGPARNPIIVLLIAYITLAALFAFGKALVSQDAVRRRCMMVLMFSITIAVAIVLQIIWPLTPFTALGCLICNCFFHTFVIQDEQAAKHMAELENALERARTAEKARSMFFSIVSHDIRTPLNAILGYSELLQFGGKSQEEKDEALKAIRASGTTLLQLVNDVLDLAKMDSGNMILHPTPMRLSQLVDDVFASFRKGASEKGIELINKTGDVPTILLDEHCFRQILFNLVGNAVKFTEHGSVTVGASFEDNNLEVSVSDTGCGIPSDMLARILDPFVQVNDPGHSGDRVMGTGLGLSICKSLVEAMEGEIIVESELGKGSIFKVRIPGVAACDKDDAAVAKTKAAGTMTKVPEHVLVVDDSPVNRAVLTAFLKRAGVTKIEQACDGAEALAKLDAAAKAGNPCDFVLSDFWMPNMNGMEFIEKLRADVRFSQLPVYILTADTEFQNDARTKLFTGTLLKPLTYDKLMEALS